MTCDFGITLVNGQPFLMNPGEGARCGRKVARSYHVRDDFPVVEEPWHVPACLRCVRLLNLDQGSGYVAERSR